MRHDPTQTTLHALAARHLKSFLAFAKERSGRALPRYVVEEFHGYLRCGMLAHSFRGSLNAHVRLHVIAADGVWRGATDGSAPVFVATRPPTRADLEGVLVRVAERVAKGIERAGEAAGDRDGARDDALDGCQRAAHARGEYGVVRDLMVGCWRCWWGH